MRDVAIVGLGPAGRSLAHHCAAVGLSVLAVDPTPEGAWRPTYGVWSDEIDGLLPASAARSRIDRPAIAAPEPRALPRSYVVLDNTAVQAHLHLKGVDVREQRLDDEGVTALRAEARTVIDARGARPARPADAARRPAPMRDLGPAQTAYGIVVSSEAAEPALRGQSGLLMDWSLDWDDTRRDATRVAAAGPGSVPDVAGRGDMRVPTFLYAIPLGDGTVLLEETALAASPALGIDELRARLRRRLTHRGVAPEAIDDPISREHVVIPMLGRDLPPPPGAVAIGTAGAGGNIVTGYSVAHSLRSAPVLAGHLAAGHDLPSRQAPQGAELLRDLGLRALLRLDIEGTLALFDAFSRVPPHAQRAFLDRSSAAGPLLGSMAGIWRRMPARDMRELVRATFGA